MLLISYDIDLILNWSTDRIIYSAAVETKIAITDTNIYAGIANLSTQDKAKLLQQLKSGFKKNLTT